jgi:aspartyl aminopeptidase
VSDAIFKEIMDRCGAKYQNFCSRADMPCGTTLGGISTTRVAINSVDIGLAQLAMHSANETASTSDYLDMEKLMCAFYTTYLVKQGNKTEIK